MFDKNKYQKEYQSERYYEVRDKSIEYLGGKCVNCGSLEGLEFDHIDPEDKSFSIGKLWGIKQERLKEELKKCQLLCKPCHIEKTVREQGRTMARGTHGTLSSYRYCKCDTCREAWNRHSREYQRRTRSKVANAPDS